ncbi:MAG: type II toxin-antitoxin system RelE/ParE family toxin [Chloroflexi bacterium]|nr:MAG: type II toxin-antitoxin system RelE/ParE family toxin [Chloroflexota bacterium]
MRRLPKKFQKAIIAALNALGDEPRAGKPLIGELAGVWSLRRGDYRVLYRINDGARRVEIARIGHRRDVYRRR